MSIDTPRFDDQSSRSSKDPGHTETRTTSHSIELSVHESLRRIKLDLDGHTLNSSGVWKQKRLVLTPDSLYFLAIKGNDRTKVEILDSIPLHEIVNVRAMELPSFMASFEEKKSKKKTAKAKASYQSVSVSLVYSSETADTSEHSTTRANRAVAANGTPPLSGTNVRFNTREANSSHVRAMYRSFSRGALKNIDSIVSSTESKSAIEVATVEGGYNDGQVGP
jgi:hypothetical protein